MYKQRYEFVVGGRTPLIMHADSVEWSDRMQESRLQIEKDDEANFKKADDRCPPETWKGYLYNDGKHIAIPHEIPRATLLKAGARVTLKGKKTYKELSQSGIMFDDPFVKFMVNGKQIEWSAIEAINGKFLSHCEAVKALGFSLFMKRVAVGQAKHVRIRPKFDIWSAQGTLLVVNEAMTEEVLQELWRICGIYLGWCDWRPGAKKSPGPFGQFTATIKKIR